MKILVLGYGSMGRRRIRLLKKIYSEAEFICVDTNTDRINEMKKEGVVGYNNIKDALDKSPDFAFVCTSPGHHADIIIELLNSGIHVFTELNLTAERYDEIMDLSRNNNLKVFMSNTMLYDKQINAIINKVQNTKKKKTYLYHVGQYLPDWHPWENYKDYFISKKGTNGCREILAIQLPWIIKLFGKVEHVSVIKRKNSDLDIDFFDTYIINIEHENGDVGVFVCDVLAKKAMNYLEIIGENLHVIWNGTPETLSAYNEDTQKMELLESYTNVEHLDEYSDIIIEDQYLDEIKAFIQAITEDKKPLYSLEDDKYVLELIDKIEGDQLS